MKSSTYATPSRVAFCFVGFCKRTVSSRARLDGGRMLDGVAGNVITRQAAKRLQARGGVLLRGTWVGGCGMS